MPLMPGSRSCLSLPWKWFSSLCCALWPYSVTFLHFLPIHSGWTVGQPFFDLGTALFSKYCEQCHKETNLRRSCLRRFRSCQEKRKKVTKTCTNIILGAMHILPGSVSQMCQLSTPCVVAANSRHTNTKTQIFFGRKKHNFISPTGFWWKHSRK